jgi:hypothetical protein
MRVLEPNSQDRWTELDWAAFNFLTHCANCIRQYEMPSQYYEDIINHARAIYGISFEIQWRQAEPYADSIEESAGWELGLEGADITAFILRWR